MSNTYYIMRRAIAVLTAVLCLGAGLVPAAASTGPGVDRLELAWASWSVPTDDVDRFRWYFGAYLRWSDLTEDNRGFATIGKGLCERDRNRNSVSISCEGRGPALKPDQWEFSADPALTSARLVVRRNGRSHRVDWKMREGRPAPGFFTAEGQCSLGAPTGGGLHRDTRAVARLFGRRFAPRYWFDWSFLMSGGFLDPCTGYYERIASRLYAGKSISVNVTIPR